MPRSTVLRLLAACSLSALGAGCLDFQGAEATFCQGANPEQQVAICGKAPEPPPPATALTVTGQPRSVQAGTCSEGITLQVLDAAKAPATLTESLAVTLQGPPDDSLSLHLDAACSTPLTELTLKAGTSSGTFYFRSRRAGPLTLSASAPGLAGASLTSLITPAPASRLVLETTPHELSAGECSPEVLVRTLDAFGNASSLQPNRQARLSAPAGSGLAFFTEASCALQSQVLEVPFATGESTARFHVRGTVLGTHELSISLQGLSTAAQSVTVHTGPPSTLVFLTASQTPVAGECSGAATVQLRDAYGNPTPAAASLLLALTAVPPMEVAFYSDADCKTPATAVTLGTGTSTADFYFRSERAQALQLTASTPGVVSASQAHTVRPAAPATLVFLTPSQRLTAGTCSQASTLQARDAFGNPSAPAASQAVLLAASPATGFVFYSDAACTTAVTTGLTLPADTTRRDFYFRGSVAGQVTLSATSAGLSGTTQAQTLEAGSPSRLALTSALQTLPVSTCSAAVVLQVQDTHGNPTAASSALTVGLSASPGGPVFYSDASCTTPISQLSLSAQASFYFQGSTAQAFTLTASSPGLTAATQAHRITATAPSTLAFTTPPRAVPAGSCSGALTLQTQDGQGTPILVEGPLTVSVSVNPTAGLRLFADSRCTQQASQFTVPDGADSVSLYFSHTTAGTRSLTASASGLTSTTQSASITPLAPTALRISTPAHTVVAGQCSAEVVLESQDVFNNESPVSTSTALSLSAAAGAGLAFYSDAGCTSATTGLTLSAGSSSTRLYFKATTAGLATLTASASSLSPASQEHSISAAPPDRLVLPGSPQSVPLGQCSSAVLARIEDSYGNEAHLAEDARVSLTASPSDGVRLFADPSCATPASEVTLAQGASASFFFQGTRPQTVTLSAAVAGLTSASQSATLTPVPPSALAFTTAPQSLTTGSCSAIVTVQTRDPFGNPAPPSTSLAVGLSASPSEGVSYYSDPGCTTAVSQVVVPTSATTASLYLSGTVAGSTTLTAFASGLSNASQTASIQPRAPSALGFTSMPLSIPVATCTGPLTVQTRDAYGNVSPVGADTVVSLTAAPAGGLSFYSDASCTSAAAGLTVAAGSSQASAYVQGSTPGTVTVSAAASGMTGASQSQSVVPGAPSKLVLLTSSQSLLAGKCSAPVTVQSRDAGGNPTTAAVAVALSSSPAGLSFFSDPGCASAVSEVAIPGGASSATFYFKGTRGGPFTLTTEATGLSSAAQPVSITSMVRSGTCPMANLSQQVTCPLSPPLLDTSKALLTFQATNTDTGSKGANVRCYLASTSSLSCERSNGSATNIHWSVAEFASGVRVQHFNSVACAGSTTSVTIQAVDPARTFLLLSSQRGSNNQGSGATRTATLATSTRVDIQLSGTCGTETSALQVVEFSGATVTRGTTEAMTGATLMVASLPSVDPSRTLLLYSYRTAAGTANICNRAVRGELSSASSLIFSRGAGLAGCTNEQIDALSWERVELPPGTLVQPFTLSMGKGTTTATYTLPTPVDLTRSLVLAGGQWASGQTHGEGAYSLSELIGEMRARATLTATTAQLSRDSALEQARWTGFALQLQPWAP